MSLDMDQSDYNETEVRVQLAAQYGVPAELITLSVEGGSLLLTVTIEVPQAAAANGTANDGDASVASLSIDDILSLVSSVCAAAGAGTDRVRDRALASCSRCSVRRAHAVTRAGRADATKRTHAREFVNS